MSDIYTSTQWQDYPNITTRITAAELNRMENAILQVPKETATFLFNSIFNGLKSNKYYLQISSLGTSLQQEYAPASGDKLVVWKNRAIPCKEGTDYTIEENNGGYTVKAVGVLQDVYIQVWNIPTDSASGGTIGTAYTNISSLTTDSISGDVTQGE